MGLLRAALLLLSACILFGSCVTSRNMEQAVESADLDELKMELALHRGLLDMRDDRGRTILHLSSEKGRREVVDLLLAEGASPHARDLIGSTPLHIAAYEGHADIVQQLVTAGANTNTIDDYGITPLLNALFGDHLTIASFLLRNGADVDHKSRNGSPALLIAAQKAKLKFMELFLEYGADILARGRFNSTVLHAAVASGRLEAVKFVVAKGATVNVKDTYGRTPLHDAVINNHATIVAYLVNRGADPWAKDLNGYAPLNIAENKGFTAIGQLLVRATPLSDKRLKVDALPADPAAAEALTSRAPPLDPAAGQIDLGNYHALVIGNDNYTHFPVLKSACNDARVIADILRTDYGFRVELLLNADRTSILLALTQLRTRLTTRDNLLLYYAGHGWLDREGDEGYWLPVDAAPTNTVNWVSNSTVTTMIKAMKAKHVLVMADSCYSGKLARGIHVVDTAPGYLVRMARKRARSVLSSGGIEPVVDSGGVGRHSVFAWAVIDALNTNRGMMSGMQLFVSIRRPVMLGSDQTPEYADIRKAGHDGGDFIFLKKR